MPSFIESEAFNPIFFTSKKPADLLGRHPAIHAPASLQLPFRNPFLDLVRVDII